MNTEPLADIGKKPWYMHPGRLGGACIMAYFTIKLLILLHLTVLGRMTPGYSGRLTGSDIPEPGAPVIYFYTVDEVTYNGWRRGIEYGGQELSIAYSPLLPRLHLCSVRPGLDKPWRFWSEIDFWLRLFLAFLGLLAGWLLIVLCRILESRRWTLLHGLEPGREA